jgi:hypothetical protein
MKIFKFTIEWLIIKTNLEYVGWVWVEDLGIGLWNNLCHCIILQLGQSQLQSGKNNNEYRFTLVNFIELFTFLEDLFPTHMEWVFFFDNPCEASWKVVLKNEPWGRHVENAKDKGLEVNLLTIGNDQDFLGLWCFAFIREWSS